MGAPPQVSVIICHHAGDLLRRLLDSLLTSTGVTYETIIVSSIPLPHLPEDIRVIDDTGEPAHKRNRGAQAATSPYLIFLDDDLEVSPYCLYELWRWAQLHPACAMAFAHIRNMERRQEFDDCGSWLTPTGFLWSRAQGGLRDTGQFNAPVRCLASKSATCLARRDVFFAVGGFDASYGILAEESDLAWRCWLAGHEVWYVPTALSFHAFNTTLKPTATHYSLERIHRYGSRNYVSMLLTNLGLWRLCRTLPLHLAVWMMAATGFVVLYGDWHRAKLVLLGIRDAFWRLPQTWRKRRQVQRRRVISDRALMRIVKSSPPASYYVTRIFQYLVQKLHG